MKTRKTIQEKFVDILRKEHKNMYFADMSRQANVHKNTILNWTNNGNTPTLEKAEKFLSLLGYQIIIRRKRSNDKNKQRI